MGLFNLLEKIIKAFDFLRYVHFQNENVLRDHVDESFRLI